VVTSSPPVLSPIQRVALSMLQVLITLALGPIPRQFLQAREQHRWCC
jgi:hypothetical protein